MECVKRGVYSLETIILYIFSSLIEEYKQIRNYYELSKKYKIAVSTLIEWVKLEFELKQELSRKKHKRLSGAGTKLIFANNLIMNYLIGLKMNVKINALFNTNNLNDKLKI